MPLGYYVKCVGFVLASLPTVGEETNVVKDSASFSENLDI